RFRCVSKTWKSLISHPIMVKLHLQRSSKNPHVLLTFEDNNRNNDNCYSFAATCSIRRLLENPSSTVDDGCYQFNDKNHFVVGVCNGLVCLLNSLDRDDYEEYWVRFWNPATRTMSEDSPRLSLHWRKYKTGRNDWVCGYPRCGFGYDGLSDTYKVVIILSNVKLQRTEVRVHCVGDTRWRKTLTCPVFPFMEQLDGKFVGGTVNWLALHMSSSYYRWEDVNVNEIVIFSYDLNTQTYKYLLLPDGLSEVPHVEPILGVLKGCMCLSHEHRRTHFVVWQMMDFGVEKSWTQLLNVSYQHLQVHDFPSCPMIPLCMTENNDLFLLANNEGEEFVVYNRKDNRVQCTEVFKNGKFKAKTIASERLRLGGDSSVAPTFPMLETNASDNADETSRKTLRKRGRKTTSKVLFQVPFSFQPPEFCLKENINLEIYYIHSASQKTLRSHQEVIEFLLDVEIPRKGGSKKAKVVGAVDNQVSGSASHESSRRKEMSFTSQIVNKMKSSDEKGTNELDNKVMSDELKNKMKDLEKEIMPWDDDEMGLYKMVDINEIENELMIQEMLNQPGELLFNL
ncbi:F-box/kelch-repeat protein, partial [Glycine soja]